MDLRLERDDHDASYWTVLSDVMTSMFFLVILYVLVQHLRTFAETHINERLAARQSEIKSALTKLDERFRGKIAIDSLAPDRQRLTFRSDVLFAVCRSDLTPDGRALLAAVGQVLGAKQNYFEAVQVEGHTDKAPTGSYGCTYPTNWELSSDRATTVVRLMRFSSAVSGPKLSAIGRAEFHPVAGAEDDSPEAYSRNRRIEIVLQYDRSAVAVGLNGEASVTTARR
jgi:flagellar motor protein MotB